MAEDLYLSIIVPVYNGVDVIRTTLPLLAEQLHPNMELLLIDDGSDDESGGICKKMAEQYAKVRYFYQENRGVVSARNLGLRKASGKYICFFDQDDYAELKVYGSLYEKMESTGATMGMCSTGYGTAGNWDPYERMRDIIFCGHQVLGLVYQLLLNGYEYPFCEKRVFFYGSIWKCIFRRSWLLEKQIAFHVYKHYEDDWLFVLESLLQSECVVCAQDCGYYWNEYRRSVSHTRKYQSEFIEKTLAYEEHLKKLLSGYMPQENYDICMSAIFCNDLIDCVDNIYCASDRITRKAEQKKVYLLAEKLRMDGSLKAAKKLKKNVYRRRMTLGAMDKYGFHTGFVLDKALCALIKIGSSIRGIRRLERKGKHRDALCVYYVGEEYERN